MAIINPQQIVLTGIKALDSERIALVNLVNTFYENVLKCRNFEEELSLTEQFIGNFSRQMETYLDNEITYTQEIEPLPGRRQRQDALLQRLRAYSGQNLSYGSSFEVFQLAVKGLAPNIVFGSPEDN